MLTNPPDCSKIFVRYNNSIQPLTFWAWADNLNLICTPGVTVPDAGPNITTYTGDPMDLFSADGIPAEKWSDVPVGSLP